MVFYKNYSDYAPGGKKGPVSGVTCIKYRCRLYFGYPGHRRTGERYRTIMVLLFVVMGEVMLQHTKILQYEIYWMEIDQ